LKGRGGVVVTHIDGEEKRREELPIKTFPPKSSLSCCHCFECDDEKI
jgi:hypothetical protein